MYYVIISIFPLLSGVDPMLVRHNCDDFVQMCLEPVLQARIRAVDIFENQSRFGLNPIIFGKKS